ncbi:MAG TPA: OmpA family protein [Polyangiaceae bacterium]|nr:OmpA family protein [Polyangiaceae bacterium]
MKHTAIVIGPVLATFLVGACAQNAKPPNTAQQSAEQARKADEKAQKDAQEARNDARTAEQKRNDAEREFQHKDVEARQAEQIAQQTSHQAGHAEQQAGAAAPRMGATEAQAGTAGQPKAENAVVVAVGWLFPTNGAELSSDAELKLAQLAAVLRANPGHEVIATGYTDDRGDAAFNKSLSQRRAQAVSDYLASQGVPKDRIMTRGLGEATPASKTVEGRAMNRRVEIVVQPTSGPSGQPK